MSLLARATSHLLASGRSVAALGLLGCMPLVAPACSDEITADAPEASTADANASHAEAGATACTDSASAATIDASSTDQHCRDGDGAVLAIPATTCPTGPVDTADSDGGDPPAEPETPPHEGTEADDDDCKFHVSFVTSCLARNQDVFFAMTPTNLTDGSPVPGAHAYLEATLDNLPSPNIALTTTEQDGVYQMPVRFDRPGRWTVRVHLFPECNDSDETSKHAHVAFYVDVP